MITRMLCVLGLGLALSACMKNEARTASFPVVPDGLKDCEFYYVESKEEYQRLTVVRCPNSATTTVMPKQGKVEPKTIIVIDGVEYAPTPKK